MPKNKPFKELIFSEKYKSYTEFHLKNKEEIYKSIVELFKNFIDTKNKTQSIIISATIENIEWTTELIFNKKEFNVLKNDIMPYFEDNEDYEMCSEIINVTKNLT
jgi:hypothetical protein